MTSEIATATMRANGAPGVLAALGLVPTRNRFFGSKTLSWADLAREVPAPPDRDASFSKREPRHQTLIS